jgi:RNA recognition motif-containing protein
MYKAPLPWYGVFDTASDYRSCLAVEPLSRSGSEVGVSHHSGEASRRSIFMATKLYVGGLSYDTTEEELRALFEQVGTVTSVSIPSERDTGRSRGFGFVEMATDGEAERAIQDLNGRELGGRTIRVDRAREREGRGGGYRPERGGGRRW